MQEATALETAKLKIMSLNSENNALRQRLEYRQEQVQQLQSGIYSEGLKDGKLQAEVDAYKSVLFEVLDRNGRY